MSVRAARLSTVVRRLTSWGFEPATLDGRPVTPADADADGIYPPPDGGEFIAEDGARLFPESERRPGMVLLQATGKDWFMDLYSMTSALKAHGYSTEKSPYDTAVWVRWATAEEKAERAAEHARRVAPLLAALIP
jgi:hypothetical protein